MIALTAIFAVVLQAGVPNDPRPFNPRDLAGIWSRAVRDGGPACGQECGDRGISNDVPPMTPEGQARFDANRPSYGRPLGSPLNGEHIGRVRAIPPALNNDPNGMCNPSGPTRMMIYPDPIEFIVASDRLIMHMEWTNNWREIWTDGRKPPASPDLPRWYGYSAGRWDGDTFVVETTGVDDRTWLDHFGYPHSEQMRLEERYRRTAYNKLELIMTIDDPKTYTKPWVSQKKVFILQDKSKLVNDGWQGLLDMTCAPIDEVEQFNKRVRDPVGGVSR
jgi:hypothetical protein